MQALKGLKVLDISRVLAGPNCTQLLADFGAEVWKVEAPWGDESRGWRKAGFAVVNRGKKSIVVNFADPRGQEIVKKLGVKADIAVENFKVGNLARFGIDFPSLMKLNERLIACSVTGFGQTGPYNAGLGYDMVLQAMSGLMSVSGDPDRPPARVGIALYDVMLGLNATIGILMALNERHTSGKGQYIDVSLFDVSLASLLSVATSYLNEGIVTTRQGSIHPTHAPVEPIEASDGSILVCCGTDVQFERLCNAIGKPELATDPLYATNAARMVNRAGLAEILEGKMKSRTRAEWQKEFLAHRVPAGPINDVVSALNDPHAEARKVAWSITGQDGHPLKVVGNALQHMSRTPPVVTSTPPRLGQHTEEVLRGVIGMSDADIQTLARAGVIGLDKQAAAAE